MQIAVCDDDPEELVRISSILDDYRQERKASICYRTFHSATELLATAKSGDYDLYLLDVMMPAVSGMEAARELRGFDQDAALVFLTSSPEFAVESYRYKAQDYLLKPAKRERLFPLLDALLAKRQASGECLSVKTKTGATLILYERLAYVEVVNKWVYFHLSDGSVREVASPLSAFEADLLTRPEFVRTHRAYLVNLIQVAELRANELTTLVGDKIPVSRQNYAEVREAYLGQLFARRGRLK
ncbi:MAG: LytTR family DNA-binding domain-containing protein [Oscillospiraceae bacterium]|nr:LytTR family DNA-binding domain-containing protein [Oscillospiraceae bacterium]